MRDKRPVDELSIEELERILAIRKREARQAQARLQRYAARRVAPLSGGGAIPDRQGNAADDAATDAESAEPASTGVFFEDEATATGSAGEAVPNGTAPAPEHRPDEADTGDTSDATQPSAAPQAPMPVIADMVRDASGPRFEDEIVRARRPQAEPRSVRRMIWNRALLAIEVLAVLGFIVLLAALFASVQSITQTTAQIQAEAQATIQALQVPPTATPTINIAQIVLPGGHLYDAQNNTARLNLDEIPAQYRDAYQQAALTVVDAPPPTQSPQAPLNIRIPAINVYSPIVAGDGWAELQRGVGHHLGSANPGERGNMVLVAHNDVFGEIFKDLEKLQPGDKIYVTTQSKEYVYVVRTEEIVLPTEVRVLDNTQRNVSQVTLITCHPYRVDSHRYVVVAELETS